MRNQYNRKLDRLITHNTALGSYGHGMHDFIMDELELGARVAMAFDEEEQAWWEIVGNKLIAELMYGDRSDSNRGFSLPGGD